MSTGGMNPALSPRRELLETELRGALQQEIDFLRRTSADRVVAAVGGSRLRTVGRWTLYGFLLEREFQLPDESTELGADPNSDWCRTMHVLFNTSMPTERRARHAKDWTAWAGTVSDLQRLARELVPLVQPALDSRLASIDEEETDRLARAATLGNAQYEVQARTDAETMRRLARERLGAWAEATYGAGSLEERGEPNEVIETLDPRSIEKLELTAPGGNPTAPASIRISLDRQTGCRLSVQGTDPSLVAGTFESLRQELQRGIPRWHWMRRESTFGWYAMATGLILAVALWPHIQLKSTDSLVWRALAAALLALLPAIGGAALLLWITKRFMPGFELLEPGATPKGRRVLGFVAYWAVTLLIAVASLMITR